MNLKLSLRMVLTCALLGLGQSAAGQTPPESAGGPGPARFGEFLRQVDGLAAPQAVAVSAAREIFVVERNAHRVSVLDREGNWLRALGAPGAAASQPIDPQAFGAEAGQFDRPAGIAIAPDGSIYVADTYNHRVQVFNAAGAWQRAFGQRGAGPTDLYHPTAIAATGDRVYVADSGNGRVQVFDQDGAYRQTMGGFGQQRPGDFLRPSAIAIAENGRVFVADADQHRIQRFDANAIPGTPISDRGYFPGLLASPMGLAIHRDQLFVADSMNHRIQVFDLEGKVQYQWGLHVVKPRDGYGKLHYPSSIAIDPQGEFAVVAEPAEDRIQIFGLKREDDPILADWNMPDPEPGSHFGERVCISGDMMFLSEPETCEIQVYDQTQRKPIQVSTFGGYGSTPGKFIQPAGMCFDLAARRLYVCDPGNQRVQVFRVGAVPRPLKFDAMLVSLECAFDLGVLAPAETGARVEPVAVTIPSAGQLLVLDRRNGRLVHLRADGQLLKGPTTIEPPLADATDLATHRDWWTWVYIADAGARNVRVGTLDRERRWRSMPGSGASQARFVEPFGVAAGLDGVVYATDSGRNRVQSFLPKGGGESEAWGTQGLSAGQFQSPRGVAVDAAGLVTVIDYGNHRAQTFAPDGEFLRVFGARWYSQPAEASASTQPAWPPAISERSATQEKQAEGKRNPAQQSGAPPVARGEEMQARSPLGGYEVIAHLSQFPPPLNKPFEVGLVVRDAKTGGPASAEAVVTVDAAMPEHRHGLMSSPRVEHGGAGRYRVHDLNFHMPGYWELYVDLGNAGVVERVVLPMHVD